MSHYMMESIWGNSSPAKKKFNIGKDMCRNLYSITHLPKRQEKIVSYRRAAGINLQDLSSFINCVVVVFSYLDIVLDTRQEIRTFSLYDIF